jgi:4-amino-4-deoxy-L-arabinose transferase-like glycosyltransferase
VTNPGPLPGHDLTLPRGFVRAVVALGLVLYVLPLLLPTPLLDPDEGLHAAIAQEMVERGDWVTPRLLGEPFLDKPILFFWSLAASLAVFGPHEFAVKLPGLLFGALGAFATGRLASRMFGRTAGWLAALFQATMLLPLALTEVAVHDVALVPWTTLAMLALWRAAESGSRRAAAGWGAVAGVWLGLSLLTKALTGVALVGLPFAVWALLGRRLRLDLIVAGVVSLVCAAAVAAPWYIAMAAANPGYLHYYFVERHLLGYATTSQLHGLRAWWYYLPVLAAGGLPWFWCLPFIGPSSPEGGPGEPASGPAGRLSLMRIWWIADLLFLSAAGSKLATYLLPAFPAIAAHAAVSWRRALQVPRPRPSWGWRAAHLAGFVPLAALAPVSLYVVSSSLDIVPGKLAWLSAAVCAGTWLAVAFNSLRQPLERTLVSATWGLTLTCAVGLVVLLPAVAGSFTARDVARHYNGVGRLPGTLRFFDERVGSFVFYLTPELRRGLTPDRIVHARPETILAMRQAPPDTVVIMPVEELSRLARRVPLSARPSVLAGHHRIYEATDFVEALRAAVEGVPRAQ